MSLDTKISLNVLTEEAAAGDLETAKSSITKLLRCNLPTGVAAAQGDLVWSDERSLATAANEDLDLSPTPAGLLGAKTFAKLKTVIVEADELNTTDITFTSKAVTGVPLFVALGDGLVLKAGDWFAFAAPKSGGKAVAPGSDIFNVANSAGASGKYRVIFIGASA